MILNKEKLKPDFSLTSLKIVYKDYFPIGNIIDSTYMEEPYFSLLKHHYSILSPGNNLKPEYLAPNEKGGAYKWERADNMVNTALENGFKIFGHTLVWHRQTPAWMTQGSACEVKTNLQNYITEVLKHFKGRVHAWDVVNEAFNDDLSDVTETTDWKNCLRNTYRPDLAPWHKVLGADYIEFAFRTAREADPDITLYYNDYNMNVYNKARAVANMVKDINTRYKAETRGNRNLIEGVGLQSHYQIPFVTVEQVKTSIDMFIDLGVEIAISELDIRMVQYEEGECKDSVMTTADAQTQAEFFFGLFELYKSKAEYISHVTMWGMDDGNSWLSIGNPCLFDRYLNAKPAFHAIAKK